MSKTVRIKGLDKFVADVRKKSKSDQTAIGQEVQRSGLRIEKLAKRNAPWDTGYMSMSIYSWKAGDFKSEIISPANYSIWVEEGTRRQAAQPFLGPAVDSDYPVFLSNIKKIVGG
jgi:HK97 gp10 family phage protein